MPWTSRRMLAALAALALSASLVACSSDGAGVAEGGSTTTVDEPVDAAGDATTTPVTGGEPLSAYADYTSVSYDDPTHWVCRPDAEDICDGDLDSTTVEADGTTTVVPFEAADDPAIDCFYVYPTISRDRTTYSDWEADPEAEGYVTVQQAARLATTCRVFAPVYRQRTLAGLARAIGGADNTDDDPTGRGAEGPYEDVLDAFRTYMAQDNQGRGFVLVGHSQGTAMLTKLIAEEIDPDPEMRSHLVAAYLAGGTVTVPEGEVVGGTFDEVPLCTDPAETGCVVTWSTFRSDAPPDASSFFGRSTPQGPAGCVNPASIAAGDDDVALDAYFPANATASILSSLGAGGNDDSWLANGTEITTPFVTVPGLITGRCATGEGVTYLAATAHDDPGPRADAIPGDLGGSWGLHLVDLSIVMGDVVTAVEAQADTYAG